MSAPDDELDLDALEQTLTAELGLLVKLGMGAIGSPAKEEGVLIALHAQRPEAKRLADAGRPERSQALEQTIAEFEAARTKLQTGIATTFAKADAADNLAAAKARGEIDKVWDDTTAEQRKAEAARAIEWRKHQ